jgi:hypothetical protein
MLLQSVREKSSQTKCFSFCLRDERNRRFVSYARRAK